LDVIAVEAQRRERMHAQAGNYCGAIDPKRDGLAVNLMGLKAEKCFADEFGLLLDLSPRPDGDHGRDFSISLRCRDGAVREFAVDVKASATPGNLICKASLARPDTIYVLARYRAADDQCELLGWDWGVVLMQSEPKRFTHNGPMNYFIPRANLRPIAELRERLVP
jgi:hypothetical protein